MCRAWSTPLAGRPGGAGARAMAPPVPSCSPVMTAGRGWLSLPVTVTGASPVPGASGRLAAARSATAATASKTRASGTFGASRFFMALLLGYRRRLPQSCLGSWAGVPGTYGAVTSGGGRAAPLRPVASPPPRPPGWPARTRRSGPGPAPWPAPRRGLAGRPATPPASGAHAGSSARWHGSASYPHQPPSSQAGNAQSRPSPATVLLRPRRGEHLAGYPASPAHPGDRGLRVIAELLRHPLRAPPAAVGPQGRGSGRAGLTRAGRIGALQRRHEQRAGPNRAGAATVSQ